MKKYIVKVPYIPALGLFKYYKVSTRNEAENIKKQCIKAEIIIEVEE